MPPQLFNMYFFLCEISKWNTNTNVANALNGSVQLMESQSWLYAPGNE